MKKTILVLIGLSLWGMIYFFLQKTQEKVTSRQNSELQAQFTEIMKFNLQNINHSTWVEWQQAGVTDSTEIVVRAIFVCPDKHHAESLALLLQKENLDVSSDNYFEGGAEGIMLTATYPKYRWNLLKMNSVGKSLLLTANSVKSHFMRFELDQNTL